MDPYVYPGTNVLKNLRDIRELEKLAEFEAIATVRRLVELERSAVGGKFDMAHLRSIHRHIFQDVYPWAGEIRTVNISRSGQFPFAFSDRIAGCLETLFSALANERFLDGLAAGKFCNRAAFYMGELNAIPPFRDGNGRTQREFIRQLARRNGFSLDWTRVTRDQMGEASKLSFQRGDNSGLEEILVRAAVPR